ncbi:hypothetical protein HDV05_000333 [Chytridiales sp. JEL 0842]|nr:hypothetical protein HDV05_000333 [Chytridiales sp. JEL 0842]
MLFLRTQPWKRKPYQRPWTAPKPLEKGHPWYESTEKAKRDVARLSLEEKVDMVTGTGWQKGPCVGNIKAIPKINFPGLCLQDGPAGIRFTDDITAFPASINVAATFDKKLMETHGTLMGKEFRSRGVHVALAPMVNLIRAPCGGRNWEGQGGDPYLTSVSSSLQVRGIQSQGVIATVKHLIGNEQEHARTYSSSNIDERVLREVYLLPFEACVKEGAGAVMCSYNLLNGVYTCENSELVNYMLKGPEIDFRGFVMTDWWSAVSDLPTAFVSDMMMPGEMNQISFPSSSYFGTTLLQHVESGTVPESRLNDMVTRILAARYQMKQDEPGFPPLTIDSWKMRQPRNWSSDNPPYPESAAHARKVAGASSILLKNVGDLLPLRGVRTLGIIGEDAGAPKVLNAFVDRGGNDGTLAQGWGSGTTEFPYLVSPLEGITKRATRDGIQVKSTLKNSDVPSAQLVASESDVAIVFANANSGEAYITVEGNVGDRNDLKLLHGGDDLIKAVADVNQNTIVVLHTVGAVDMPWIDHPNVKAVVFALLPGQESGNAIADVLFGDVNPSGRLPFTIHRQRSDYAADVVYTGWLDWFLGQPVQIDYKEGLLIDHMHADAMGIEPLFSFGYGLSYTTFELSDLRVKSTSLLNLNATAIGGTPGKSLSVDVSVIVRNVGGVDGEEVVQLYISFPESAKEPPQLLRGFEKVFVKANSSVVVNMTLGFDSFRIWEVGNAQLGDEGRWKVVGGVYEIRVGRFSRDPSMLRKSIELTS